VKLNSVISINILPGHPPPPTYLSRLLLSGTITTGPSPGYVAKVGEDQQPRPPAHLPGGPREMRRFGGRCLRAEPPIPALPTDHGRRGDMGSIPCTYIPEENEVH